MVVVGWWSLDGGRGMEVVKWWPLNSGRRIVVVGWRGGCGMADEECLLRVGGRRNDHGMAFR